MLPLLLRECDPNLFSRPLLMSRQAIVGAIGSAGITGTAILIILALTMG